MPSLESKQSVRPVTSSTHTQTNDVREQECLMRKSLSSPKVSPIDFEPELVSTLKSVLDAAVDQIDVANRTPATKAKMAERILRAASDGITDPMTLTAIAIEDGFGLRSLCPKIPFPAAPFRATQGRLAIWRFGILRGKKRISRRSRIVCCDASFAQRPNLLRIQSERLELPAPFCRSITKSFDSDAAEQTAFDRRSDVSRQEMVGFGFGVISVRPLV